MLKVLHVISGLKVGGAEMMLNRLVISAKVDEITHIVVAMSPEGAMRERFINAGVELIVLDFKESPVFNFFRLIALIRKRNPDIVQTWMYHADLLGGLAAFIAGNKNVVWGIRGSAIPQSEISATKMIILLCTLLSRYLPSTIVCCAESARVAHVEMGYDKSKMFVIPNGYELSCFKRNSTSRKQTRADFGFMEGDVVIGIVGRFDPLKDYKNFVRAVAMLASKVETVKFLMIGRGIDWKNKKLKDWINEGNLAHKVVLAGERSDIPECLAAMDVFCLSSSKEGFPNVVCEAMAMKVPCVVTDAGDAAAIVADTGIVVPPYDSAALAEGLQILIQKDIVELLRLGDSARCRIEEEYSISIATARFEKLYEQVVNG